MEGVATKSQQTGRGMPSGKTAWHCGGKGKGGGEGKGAGTGRRRNRELRLGRNKRDVVRR